MEADGADHGPRAGGQALSGRETQILTLLAQDFGTQGIARRLGVSPHTIKKHLALAMAKLGCRTRAGAVGQAFAWGFLRPEGLRGSAGFARYVVDLVETEEDAVS